MKPLPYIIAFLLICKVTHAGISFDGVFDKAMTSKREAMYLIALEPLIKNVREYIDLFPENLNPERIKIVEGTWDTITKTLDDGEFKLEVRDRLYQQVVIILGWVKKEKWGKAQSAVYKLNRNYKSMKNKYNVGANFYVGSIPIIEP